MDTSFHGIAASPWYRETASILCPPCPRTAVHHLPGLYTRRAWVSTQFINPMILKEPPNRTAAPNCHSRESGNPVLTRGIWIPACAGMTIYSRCVDTHGRREKGLRPSPSGRGWPEGPGEGGVCGSFQSFC